MSITERSNNLKIMMIYGFPANPYVEYVVRSLIKKGINISLVIRESLDLTIEDRICSVYKILPRLREGRYFSSGFSEIIGFLRLLKILVKDKPHIVHFQCYRAIRFKLGWLLFFILKMLRKKIVITIHEISSRDGLLLNDLIMAKIAHSCDSFFVHTNYTKEKIQEDWKLQEEKISIVPHGGYYLYCENYISRKYARKRLRYRQSDYVLLFFGLVAKYKGLDYLLPAVAEVKKVIPNLKLIIAGRAYDHLIGQRYRKLIIDLELEHEVNYQNRFIKNNELAGFFCCCDMVVLPYIDINQSGVLCMSYTFARPVIATQVGGLPEMVRDGITGYIIPPADIDALTEKIIEAWYQREKLQEMGLRAQKLINEAYSWDRLAEYTIGVYRKVLSS